MSGNFFHRTKQGERCGCWVVAGGFESVCMRPTDHPGECLPLRADMMSAAERHEAAAQSIYDAVTAIDIDGGWPHEGHSDACVCGRVLPCECPGVPEDSKCFGSNTGIRL